MFFLLLIIIIFHSDTGIKLFIANPLSSWRGCIENVGQTAAAETCFEVEKYRITQDYFLHKRTRNRLIVAALTFTRGGKTVNSANQSNLRRFITATSFLQYKSPAVQKRLLFED